MRVNLQSLLSSHCQSSVRRLASEPVALAVQAATTIDYPAGVDWGELMNGEPEPARRVLAHSTLAFDRVGTPLGLLDAQNVGRASRTPRTSRARRDGAPSCRRKPGSPGVGGAVSRRSRRSRPLVRGRVLSAWATGKRPFTNCLSGPRRSQGVRGCWREPGGNACSRSDRVRCGRGSKASRWRGNSRCKYRGRPAGSLGWRCWRCVLRRSS